MKAIRLRKNVGWPILKSKVFARVVYVFVCLNDGATPTAFFIGSASEVRPRIKEYPQPNGTMIRGILNYGSINNVQFRDRWDKIEAALHKGSIAVSNEPMQPTASRDGEPPRLPPARASRSDAA